jgi:uncharacterized protein
VKIRQPDLSNSPLSQEHQHYGLPPAEQAAATAGAHPVLRTATWFTAIALTALTLYLMARLFLPNNWYGGVQTIASTLQGAAFWGAVAVGLLAQAVDGALGMAYGVTATTFLLGMGARAWGRARRSPARACTSPRSSPPVSRASRT